MNEFTVAKKLVKAMSTDILPKYQCMSCEQPYYENVSICNVCEWDEISYNESDITASLFVDIYSILNKARCKEDGWRCGSRIVANAGSFDYEIVDFWIRQWMKEHAPEFWAYVEAGVIEIFKD